MWRKEDIIKKLQEEQGEQSLRYYASNVVGCSAAYLSDVYNGKRDPGKRLLDHLGLEKKTVITRTTTYKERKWK